MRTLTLLYAEDDLQSRKNYAFVLEEYFSQVYLAEDGREALNLYHEKNPDVLLLDISMPHINGLEVAKRVRQKNKDIPIIMLTSHTEQERLLEAIPLGLLKYLIKPIEQKYLTDTIEEAIQSLQDGDIILFGEKLSWNKTTHNLFYEEENIKLTKKEHKLVSLLFKNVDEYLMHNTLILQIWDNVIPDVSHDNKLHQLVYRLNKKMQTITHCKGQFIENSYTLGYRIKCDI